MPLVSIILPNYNHAAFLKERINSILNQTFEDYEVILLDDCSTDNSKDIISEYADHSKIMIVSNNENSGSTFKQWTKGINLAKGIYLWVAESDDVADHTFLEKAVQVLESNKNVGLFHAKSHWINENGKIIFSEPLIKKDKIFNGKFYILNYLLNGNNINNASALLFRKELVTSKTTKIIKQFTYCGDYLFWVKLMEKSSIYQNNEYLNYFRRHENNVSGISEKIGLDFLEGIIVYGYIRKMFPIHFLNPISKADRNWASSLQFSNLSKKLKKEILKIAWRINPAINLLYIYYCLRRINYNR
jgi:glycosyltransferase involved in cell wall biosynthesis